MDFYAAGMEASAMKILIEGFARCLCRLDRSKEFLLRSGSAPASRLNRAAD